MTVEEETEARVQEIAPGAELVARVKPPTSEEALEALVAWVEATFPGKLIATGTEEWLSYYVAPDDGS